MADGNNGVASDPPSLHTRTQPPTPPPSQPAATLIDPSFPASSLNDSGLSKRPRDARVIHMILANLGVTAYQERVPLQLMDFSYRYTSSTLQDALHLTSETYGSTVVAPGKVAATHDLNAVSLTSLRLSIASRTHYQFNPGLSKEYLQELAQERNRVTLPAVGKEWGIRLPPERYCLTGVGFGLKEEWDSEGEEDVVGGEEASAEAGADMLMEEGAQEEGKGEREGKGEEEEDNDERMEDLFGEMPEDNGEDRDMEDL